MTIALDLSKSFELNLIKADILNIPTMYTKLAVDQSGSMNSQYQNGWVQNAIDLFIGVALKFDDNGELDMGFFNTECVLTPTAVADDATTYLQQKAPQIYASGGTCFAPIIDGMLDANDAKPKTGFLSKIFGSKSKSNSNGMKTYLGIITDGCNDDHASFMKALNKLDGSDVFIQFIGIGNGVDANYMNELSGKFSFIDFQWIQNPNKMSTDEFYQCMCNEKFKHWLG